MAPNVKKGRPPKESQIIGRRKRPKLRQKSITERVSILWTLKSYQNAARAEDSGKGKMRPKRYSTKKHWKKRSPTKSHPSVRSPIVSTRRSYQSSIIRLER